VKVTDSPARTLPVVALEARVIGEAALTVLVSASVVKSSAPAMSATSIRRPPFAFGSTGFIAIISLRPPRGRYSSTESPFYKPLVILSSVTGVIKTLGWLEARGSYEFYRN
jgi:hypothetical protein